MSLYTSAAGSYSGSMTISSNSQNPTFTVNMSGTVTSSSAPSLTLRDGSTTLSNGDSGSFRGY